MRTGLLRERLVIHTFRNVADQMHPSLSGSDFEKAGELSRGRVDKRCLPLGVEHSRSSNVARKMSFGYKVREHRLFHRRGMAIGEGFSGDEYIHQVGRNNQVSQA